MIGILLTHMEIGDISDYPLYSEPTILRDTQPEQLKKIEEPELIMRLGGEYIEYRKDTPMFIPRCRSKKEANAK